MSDPARIDIRAEEVREPPTVSGLRVSPVGESDCGGSFSFKYGSLPSGSTIVHDGVRVEPLFRAAAIDNLGPSG
jgi:hypothetical protein